ncbi:MAG: hypothetical protein WC865_05740 [Bacteroidales bacterium]
MTAQDKDLAVLLEKDMVPEIFHKTADLISAINLTESYLHQRGWIHPVPE